jgi:beta-phosphoglucomutase-like phosphatase (HAD superfamily)
MVFVKESPVAPQFAVIFDMDGVLIDSVGLNWQAYNQILARYGCHVAQKDIHKYMGRSLDDQIALLDKNLNLSLNTNQFKNDSSKIKKLLFREIIPKEGVLSLLCALRDASVPVALATSASYALAKEYLSRAKLWDYFSVRIAAEDVVSHKPNPEVYTRAANRLGIDPGRCIVIEDAPAGIAAARSAGMQCIAVSTPYVSSGQLSGANLVIDSVTFLNLQLLQELAISRNEV